MYKQYQLGWIEVITGCMFAGKTEELIRRVRVLEYAKKKILVVKHGIDNRFSETKIVSHAGNTLQIGIRCNDIEALIGAVNNDIEVIVIDEVQFFDDELIELCDKWALDGKRVIVSGLDTDFRGEPFKVTASLMAKAEFVTKLSAICRCGAPATMTQRIINGLPAKISDPIILVGASEAYEARCRKCHEVKNAEKDKVGI